MAETTNCITIMMGTKGVHPSYVPFFGLCHGNTDFRTGQTAGYAGYRIETGAGNYPNAYSTSSYGSPVPAGNQNLIGKKGNLYGIIPMAPLNSSLSNRCVQFAAGRDSFFAGTSVYKRDGTSTSTGTNMRGAWPEYDATQNVNNHSSVNGTGHFQSSFYRTTAYPTQHSPSKGYVIDSPFIHLGATAIGYNQGQHFSRPI
jgi:hypothetical protein